MCGGFDNISTIDLYRLYAKWPALHDERLVKVESDDEFFQKSNSPFIYATCRSIFPIIFHHSHLRPIFLLSKA